MPLPSGAKLVPEAASGAPAASPTHFSDRDADAAGAVDSALKELGADRKQLEGPDATVVLPTTPEDKSDKPKSTGTGGTPARGEDGKFLPKETKEGATEDDSGKPAATTPASPAATPPASPAVDTDITGNLTAEDLAQIEKTPVLRKAYKSLVRGVNKRFEELATLRKGHEQDIGVMDTIRQDPIAGLRALATIAGVQISIAGDPNQPNQPRSGEPGPGTPPAATPVVPKTPIQIAEERLASTFSPEGAKTLAPILVEISKAVAAAELTPLRTDLESARAAQAQIEQERARVQLHNGVVAYGQAVEARGDDWTPEIERSMSELLTSGVVMPGKGATLESYLDVLYAHVTAARNRVAVKQRQLTRLQSAVEAAEPTHAARSTPTRAGDQKITSDMSDADATALAVAQAMEELRRG